MICCGRLLEVDGDELHVLLGELAGDLLDLRHGLDAGAAPGGPEVEDDDLALALGQVELLPVQEVELEVGGRLADQRRLGPRGAAAGRSAVGRQGRLGGVLELPLPVGELRGRLLDAAADQELVDLADADAAGAEDVALARERVVRRPARART